MFAYHIGRINISMLRIGKLTCESYTSLRYMCLLEQSILSLPVLLIHFCEQARWVKTVKVSPGVAKPPRDQTVGSSGAIKPKNVPRYIQRESCKAWVAIDWVTCRFCCSQQGLMYSQATVTLIVIEESSALCDQAD